MAVETTATDIYTGTRQGQKIARTFAAERRRQGAGLLVYNGDSFDCTVLSDEVGRGAANLLLSGASNAAFADTRTVTTGPSIFQEGAEVTFAGKPYTIASVPAPQIMCGTAISQRLILIRAPSPSDTPADLAQTAKWPAPPH